MLETKFKLTPEQKCANNHAADKKNFLWERLDFVFRVLILLKILRNVM